MTLDNLPAPVRHAIVAFLGAALSIFTNAIIGANGVTSVDWGATAVEALNVGVVAAVSAVAALWLTPLTKQYGVGSPKSDGTEIAWADEPIDEEV